MHVRPSAWYIRRVQRVRHARVRLLACLLCTVGITYCDICLHAYMSSWLVPGRDTELSKPASTPHANTAALRLLHLDGARRALLRRLLHRELPQISIHVVERNPGAPLPARKTIPPGAGLAARLGRWIRRRAALDAVRAGGRHAGAIVGAPWAGAILGAAGLLAVAAGGGVAVEGVCAGGRARVGLRGALVVWVVGAQHVTEAVGARVDAPELVRAWDELAFFVPAVDPGDFVVELEEADLDHAAAGVFDDAVFLAELVVGVEEVLFEDFGVADWDGRGDGDGFFLLGVGGASDGASVFGCDFLGHGVVVLFVGRHEVPSTARNVFVDSWDRRLPMLCSPLGFLILLLEPLPRLEDLLGRDEQIRSHPHGSATVRSNSSFFLVFRLQRRSVGAASLMIGAMLKFYVG